MIFKRIKSEGIAHNSYFIGSRREAAVIDPRRDCEVYVSLARQHGLAISHIFETHRNEDYFVGSAELKAATGADIFHGPGPDWKYGKTQQEGQQFTIGGLRIEAVLTPGHTDESVSYVLIDPSSCEAKVMVFTGDALFVNEVGRTDLYGPVDAPRLAGNLYDSLFGKILALGDGLILCPAHGAGSVCGANIGGRDESTLGIEKLHNPRLQLDRDEFIALKSAERLQAPPYFKRMEKVNLEGLPLLGHLPRSQALTPREFEEQIVSGAIVVDARLPVSFAGAHIKSAYAIWLAGLSAFAGWVLPYDRSLLLLTEDDSQVETAVRYLVRVGFDHIAGYLRGGMESWNNAGLPFQTLPLLTVHQLKDRLDRKDSLLVLDVRDQDEFESGHIEGAFNIYVGRIQERLSEIPLDRPVATVCNVGHRSALAASILQRAGYPDVWNVPGSMRAWTAAGFPTEKD